MKTKLLFYLIWCATASFATAQGPDPRKPDKAVIFAILNDGGTLEPIAYLENKKLEPAIDGGAETAILNSFHKRYFKPRSSYQLVFGGAKMGTVTIKSADPSMECARHTAQVISSPTRAKLKGNVMALAAPASVKAVGSGLRRLPTAAERSEIESLVRAELGKQKIKTSALRNLKYQNLTALDVDNDKSAEFVGTFWVEPTLKSRALLFFIAEKGADGKYAFSISDFRAIEEKDTMSEDISTVDSGVYQELLLDVLDYDADGTSEVFTYSPSFEGAGFNVYRRHDRKWAKAFEGANYRCAY